MTDEEQIADLTFKLKCSEDHNTRLTKAFLTLGSLLRDHAIVLRQDARMLQGLQGKSFRLADTLDHYAAGLLLGHLTKGNTDEQAPGN